MVFIVVKQQNERQSIMAMRHKFGPGPNKKPNSGGLDPRVRVTQWSTTNVIIHLGAFLQGKL